MPSDHVRPKLVASVVLCFLGFAAASVATTGCNAVLGIHEPEDKTPAIVTINNPKDGGRPPTSDGGAFVGPEAATHRWADWPMPNPPTTELPNPQSYDTGRTPGVVFDRVTKLEWQRSVADGTLDWADAKAYCAGLTVAGGGFRLPSRIELLSIVDFTQAEPLIDPAAFPGTPAEPFWSASPMVDDASASWSVHFGFGTVFAATTPVANPLRVRCVR